MKRKDGLTFNASHYEDGISGVNKAATDHDVLKTTLKDTLSGRVTHSINAGPRLHLNKTKKLNCPSLLRSALQLGMEKHKKMYWILLDLWFLTKVY